MTHKHTLYTSQALNLKSLPENMQSPLQGDEGLTGQLQQKWLWAWGFARAALQAWAQHLLLLYACECDLLIETYRHMNMYACMHACSWHVRVYVHTYMHIYIYM